MKKIVSLLLAFTILVSTIPPAQAAASYYRACAESYTSIVDALVSIGEDGSYKNRAAIAAANSIANFRGEAQQNMEMLRLLKSGLLRKPNSSSSASSTSSASSSNATTSSDSIKYTCENYHQCTANGATIYVIKKDKAPLRNTPYETTGNVIVRLAKNQLLSVVHTVKNTKGNTWLAIEYTDESGKAQIGYMFSGNATAHTSHNYQTFLKTSSGTLKMCKVCGLAVVSSGGQTVTANLLHIADQAARGDYAGDTTFWGLVGRVVVGEIPLAGTIADIRDLVYDLTHDASVPLLLLDFAALVPLVGTLKYLDELTELKYVDNVTSAAKHTEALKSVVKTFSIPDDLFAKHIRAGNVQDKAITGAHSLDSFENCLKKNGGSFQTIAQHPSIDGIFAVKYKVSPQNDWYKALKTLYDPEKISHGQFESWAREALNNPKSIVQVDVQKFDLVGTASNGLEFIAHINNGVVSTIYPNLIS